jgi:signal transduction histidine kinase
LTPSVRTTRLFGAVVIVLTITIAAAGFFVVRRDIDAMNDAARENILWSAVQVEIELMRFQRSLADFGSTGSQTSVRDINNRFDILWSRVTLFQQGEVGQRLSAYDGVTSTVPDLFAAMQAVEDAVVGLAPGDVATAQDIQARFEPLASRLRVLSRDVLHGEEAKQAMLRADLQSSSLILTVISAVAVLASVLLIFVFARDTNRFRQLAEQNAVLLAASNRASRAKSQFLAMMSHELRTPMNGVLGLLALVRQKGLSEPQERLLDRAERSGRQMNALLAHILDFTAIQDDQLELDYKPFEPAQLAEAVHDLFEPVAQREGIAFSVTLDPACPHRLFGDFARLRQAVTHLATYVLETAGTRNIAIDLSYADGNLEAAISFDYSQTGGEWHPELILGATEPRGDSFATEALGPAVSRGLIDRMGGSTMLASPAADRIAVIVRVPAEELRIDRLTLKIVTQSAALEAICRAAFRSERIRFLTAGSADEAHVVLVEAGGQQEAETLRAIARQYPRAMLVALGRPVNPDDFQDVIDVPIDVAKVRNSALMRLAEGRSRSDGDRELRYEKK